VTRGERGFGIAAAAPRDIVQPLAAAAEAAGFSTFWTNDTPGADGLTVLAAVAEATTSIRLGVGVVPIDRRSPQEIAETIARLDLPVDRLMLGIGSGGRHTGSLELVHHAINELRRLTTCKVAIGALGPKMIALSAKSADGVILNWLTPEWSGKSVKGISDIDSIGYVRTALPEAREVLEAEARRYESFPAYGRHFERMGVPALATCVVGDRDVIQSGLKQFERYLDETVVRAIIPDQSLHAYLELLRASAPPAAS